MKAKLDATKPRRVGARKDMVVLCTHIPHTQDEQLRTICSVYEISLRQAVGEAISMWLYTQKHRKVGRDAFAHSTEVEGKAV